MCFLKFMCVELTKDVWNGMKRMTAASLPIISASIHIIQNCLLPDLLTLTDKQNPILLPFWHPVSGCVLALSGCH